MDRLSPQDLSDLVEGTSPHRVSIFLPTGRAGPAAREGGIRLKNLLREAEEQLVALGMRAPQIQDLLAPARSLVGDSLFWSYQSDGLALFLSPEGMRKWRLPLRFEELVMVADRFHVKPLLSLFTGDGRFYVLALSQNQVRLLLGTRHSVTEVPVEEVPTALADVLRPDLVQKHLQFRTAASSGPGKQAVAYHGHGGADAGHKDDIVRFFRRVDEGLRSYLTSEPAPLVVAGVDYLLPLYREASSHPHLVNEGVTGNPDRLTPEELHAQAWALVQPHFHRAQQEAADRFAARLGTGLASAQLPEVLRAAREGRVEVLFVAVGVQRWGRIASTGEVEVHDSLQPGDQDLLDLIAVETLVRKGTVYAVSPDRVPGGADLAAVFRY
ncbi:hypothetical protein H5T55_05240 [Candidatus Bipolaricaulota bacterium]|nr:hypothetical protein [Candidatus Bipolaricaulota bacterium]